MGKDDPSYYNLKKATRELIKAKKHVLQTGNVHLAELIGEVYSAACTQWVVESRVYHLEHTSPQSGCVFCAGEKRDVDKSPVSCA